MCRVRWVILADFDRVPLIPYTLHRLQAREGACGGWDAELRPWADGTKVEGWDIEWMEVVRD